MAASANGRPARPAAARPGEIAVDRPADQVLRLTIDNPARHNALDLHLLQELACRVQDATERVIIIRGAGDTFSAGYDLHDHLGPDFAQSAGALIAHPHHRVLDALEQSAATVIAQLRGNAIGGALELAICCDLRFGADDLIVAMPAGRIGLAYSHTGLRRLIETVGIAATKELILLGRRLDARRAEALGILTAVAPADRLDAEVLRAAADIVALAPGASATNKHIIEQLRAEARALDPATERALEELHFACVTNGELAEGIGAFLDRRAPAWDRGDRAGPG